jgi:hypothetical protein
VKTPQKEKLKAKIVKLDGQISKPAELTRQLKKKE